MRAPSQMLIDGKLVAGGTDTPAVDPATEQPFALCPRPPRAQLDAAVAPAHGAFPGRSATSVAERWRLADGVAAAITANADELTRLLVQEHGLRASVWTSDPAAARASGARLGAGSVCVNRHLAMGPDLPFGGSNQSGIGVETGEEELAEIPQLRMPDLA